MYLPLYISWTIMDFFKINEREMGEPGGVETY
jgi:hypothetical protein